MFYFATDRLPCYMMQADILLGVGVAVLFLLIEGWLRGVGYCAILQPVTNWV